MACAGVPQPPPPPRCITALLERAGSHPHPATDPWRLCLAAGSSMAGGSGMVASGWGCPFLGDGAPLSLLSGGRLLPA